MKYQLILAIIMFSSLVSGLQITNYGPSGTLNTNNIELFVDTDNASNCTYQIGIINGTMNGTLQHTSQQTLEDGNYEVEYYCSGINETANATTQFTIDTNIPVITLLDFPDEIVGLPYQVELVTNEKATCKYSEEDVGYDSMQNVFSKINSSKHFTIINDKSQGSYNYYIKCKDDSGSIGSLEKEFYVNMPPTASIDLEEDPLKEGTYKVVLITSELMGETPTLNYYYNHDGKRREIALTGSGTKFEGYIVIEKEVGEKVGTFDFEGKDTSGLTGKKITSGKIFLVDTEVPEAPDSVEIWTENERVYLEWNFDDEYKEFVIYRSESPKVERVDKYKEVNKKSFTDSEVKEGITYFYRIAAIDDAKNIGEMSEEVEIFVIKNDDDEELEPILQFKLDAAIDKFESELFDYEQAKRNLQKNSNPEEVKIDSALKISEGVDGAIRKIKQIIDELTSLNKIDLTESELAKRIDNYDRQLTEIKTNVYTDIRITDQRTVSIEPDEAGVNTAISEYLLGTEIIEEDLNNYTRAMNKLQTDIYVSAQAITAELTSKLSNKQVTYVEKELSTANPVKKAGIIEIIPKEFARSASEITFSNSPSILQDDPIVQWSLSELTTQKISYYVEGIKNTNLLSLTKTIVLNPPVIKNDVPEITGNVVNDSEDPGEGWKVLVLIVLGVVVGGLLIYYGMMNKGLVRTEIVQDDDFANKKFQHIINSAHESIDNLQIEKARTLYNDSYKLYLAMNEKDKSYAYPSLNRLYNKMTLVNTIEDAHNLVDAKRFDQVGSAIKRIKSLTVHSSHGSKLHNYAESSANYFAELMA